MTLHLTLPNLLSRCCLCLRIVSGILLLALPALAQDGRSASSAEKPTEKKSDASSTANDDGATKEAASSDASRQASGERAGEATEEDEDPPPPPPWILRPYKVQIEVSFDSVPELNSRSRQHIQSGLIAHLQAQFHQMWQFETAVESAQLHFDRLTLRDLHVDDLPAGLMETELDKLFLCHVGYSSGRYTLLVREWDASSRTIGSLHTAHVIDRRQLIPSLAWNINDAFRPLAELEIVDDQRIEFLVRAGEYLPRNPEMAQFQVGDYLVPFMRYLNRQRELQKIQETPWTYLQVESVERSRIRLTITSAFGNPIAGSRRRVEILAMRIRPFLPSTEVFIFPRGEPQNPLVGYRCEVMDRVPSAEDPVEDRLKLETDRRGVVTVPVNPDSPLQYLYVYSGQALLAKVPFIPGYSPRLEVEVPDDRPRLYVEGEVSLLQSELIDIVATREVLMARARAAAKSKRWEDVNKFLSQLQDLPTLDEFTGRIDSLKVRAVVAAKAKRDRVAEIRVERLCSNISDSAARILDPVRIAEFRREMDEKRRLDGMN